MSFGLKICHFHKGRGFIYMHETTKCVLINNFIFISHCDACLECVLLVTENPYTIALKVMVLPCRMARQSLKLANIPMTIVNLLS